MIQKLWHKHSSIRFVAVGIFNTLLDFSILNFLVFAFGTNKIVANSISVSVAMLISFFLNKQIVFRDSGQSYVKKMILFIVITALGLYVIQNIVIAIMIHYLTWPASVCSDLLHSIGFKQLSDTFITLNFAKVIATGFSLVWNFFMYKKYIFSGNTESVE